MDKIKIFINKYTNQIILGLLLVLFVTSLFFTINRTLSDVDHKEFVYIYSDNTDFNQGEPGGWILYKNAYLLNKDRLRIKYQLNSNSLLTEKSKDVLFVIDSSDYSLNYGCPAATLSPGGGMESACGNEGTSTGGIDAYGLLSEINNASRQLLLEEQNLDNKVAVMTYNDTYELRIGLTNNQEAVFSALDGIEAEGYTDYSKALLGIKEFLTTYQHTNDRELKIVLYAGNVSKENNTVEKAMYDEIKRDYPFVKIYALHNVVDDKTILEKIANISDAQFLIGCSGSIDGGAIKKGMSRESYVVEPLVAAITPIRPEPTINIIFSQIIFSKEYSQFKIKDTINNEHFNFTDFKIIDKNNGDVTYSNNDLIWTLDRKMLTGDYIYLEVELGVNQNVILTDNLVPVSTNTQIKSILEGIPDENIDTSLTPYVSFYNKVIYNTSGLPETCNTQAIPAEVHKIGDIVDTKEVIPNCDGYRFVRWIIDYGRYYYDSGGLIRSSTNTPTIDTPTIDGRRGHSSLNSGLFPNITLSNTNPDYDFENDEGMIFADVEKLSIVDGVFNMPGYDVIFIPVFDKVTISKTYNDTFAPVLKNGSELNEIFKKTVGGYCPQYNLCNDFKKIERADATTYNSYNGTKYVISTDNSILPVYAWFTNYTLYYYSASPTIYLNEDLTGMFTNLSKLNDISGFEYLDSSKTENTSGLFAYTQVSDYSPISNWDLSSMKNMSSLFKGTPVSDLTPLANWDLSNVENISSMFANCTSVTDLTPIANWNVSNIKNMSSLFYNFSGITTLTGLENWNVSNVEDMSSTFAGVYGITDFSPISSWNVSNVKNFQNTFGTAVYGYDHSTDSDLYRSNKSTNVNALANWRTSSAENMSEMFDSNTELTNVDGLLNWDVSNVKDFSYMFSSNALLTNVDGLLNWNTSSAKNMTYMFYNNNALTNVNGLLNWNVSNVEDVSQMFYYDRKLEDISGLSNWNTLNLKKMTSMFNWATKLSDISSLSNWNVSNVEDMSHLFSTTSVSNITSLSNWNVSNVKNMDGMFNSCKISDITPLQNWNVSNVKDMDGMFYGNNISNLTPIANWDVSKVEKMSHMLSNNNISNLTPIANWDVSNITDMSYMLSSNDITNLTTIANWDVSNVKNLSGFIGINRRLTNINALQSWNLSSLEAIDGLFGGCTSLTDISVVANWDISKVKSLNYVFNECSNLQDFSPISNWNVSNVIKMESTFRNSKITDLTPIANWDVSKVDRFDNMFENCSKINDVSLINNWNVSSARSFYHMFYIVGSHPNFTTVTGTWNREGTFIPGGGQ